MKSKAEAPRILVVDDTEATRYCLTRALRAEGYRVTEVASGRDALRELETKPDLVVLDIRLPDMTGFEIVDKLRRKVTASLIPVIFASAHNTSNEDQALGLGIGGDAYLTHPVDPVVLIATVKALLRMKKAEHELRLVIDELQLQRELREQFVSVLTHDLRTPLTAAMLNAQLIARNVNAPPVSNYSRVLLDSLDRTNRMIEDLLDANRIRAGETVHLKLTECNLGELLSRAVEILKSIYGDRFQVLSDAGIVGYWDCRGLERAIDNLCSNGVKYGSSRERVKILASREGDEVVISVNNSGNPLSSEEQLTLFEPYRRTGAAIATGKRGWGLGLTLVQGFAKSHGGSVSIQSNPKSGTTFTMRLPRDARKAAA